MGGKDIFPNYFAIPKNSTDHGDIRAFDCPINLFNLPFLQVRVFLVEGFWWVDLFFNPVVVHSTDLPSEVE